MTHGVSQQTNTAAHKMLPPYAKQLKPFDGAVWIYCGRRAWKVREMQKGATKEAVVLMPEGRHPNEYRWPVNGMETWIVGLDTELIICSHLVIACLDEGASSVTLIHDHIETSFVRFPGRPSLKRWA